MLKDERLNGRWQLACALPEWPRRGVADDDGIGALCVRTDPQLDRTSGFFVALFERKADADDLAEVPKASLLLTPAQRKRLRKQKMQRARNDSVTKTTQTDESIVEDESATAERKRAAPPATQNTKKRKKAKVKAPLSRR